MTPEDVVACVTYLNQIDPRIQLNDSTTDLWFYAIEALPVDQVRWVIRDYYATSNPNHTGSVPPITPAMLKQRRAAMSERVAAKQRALEPPKNKAPHPKSFRERNPEEWDRLFQLGADQRRAELASRGIHLPTKGATP